MEEGAEDAEEPAVNRLRANHPSNLEASVGETARIDGGLNIVF